jgi:5-methylcytosine-specific restriction enzyme subunit McrC
VTRSRPELEHLSEGQVLFNVDLTHDEAAALNATKLLSATAASPGWTVAAAFAVGALNVSGMIVRVQPKVGVVKTLQLLARAHGIHHLHLDDAHIGIDEAGDLSTILATLFAHEATTAFASGPLRGYRTEDQSLSVLRGRVRLRDQELRRFGLLVPLEVTVDEWTTDTDENRLIRAACRRLLALGGLPQSLRKRMLHTDRLLADVQLLAPGVPLPDWTPTRLNTRLHRLLRLAEIVLRHAAVEHLHGEVQVTGFVVPMEKLFEDLVARILEEHATEARVSTQRTYRLGNSGQLNIRPDIVFLRDGNEIAVADTKYKILNEKKKLRNEDAYQLITYCTRLGLDVGHLIYAVGVDDGDDDIPLAHDIQRSPVRLAVHRVDLKRDLELLQKDIAAIGAAILRTVPVAALGEPQLVATEPRPA